MVDDCAAPDIAAQVPYWVAVLTPGERSFGSRRTDPRIDTADYAFVTTTHSQWTAAASPSLDAVLAVLAKTFGLWQSDRCRSSTSGVLVDIVSGARAEPRFDGADTSLFPVRLPTDGDMAHLTEEARRRIAAAPHAGSGFGIARYIAQAPALLKKPGAQIALRFGATPSGPTDVPAFADPQGIDTLGIDEALPLHHSLVVTCSSTETDGITLVDSAFQWNCRLFTQSDVDDFTRLWEKTISTFD